MSGKLKNWIDRNIEITDDFNSLKNALGFDQTLTALLWSRNVRDFEAARRFFRPSLTSLHDPFLMTDMKKAVERTLKAIDGGETILVYGDYDVDGTTAVALVTTYLRNFTNKVITYTPDRYKEGYGLSTAGIQFASDNDCTLIIALDCGIKAYEQAVQSKDLNIDLIIGDHHTPGDKLPDAFAILDPKRSDCSYPYDELSGCGIGFKLCHGIQLKLDRPLDELTPLLDLLVVSIGADIVPITGENRILANAGLEQLNLHPRIAFQLMKEEAKKSTFSITDVVFTIAPRINAAGRIEHADAAVELLLASTKEEAEGILADINEYNRTRRALDQATTEEALSQLKDESKRFSTVVYKENWHKGVIGIVASRLIENYYRPTIVFTNSHGILAGSARSVEGFDIYQALDHCKEHLIQFGGHKYAAGMTLAPENYQLFKEAFETYVASNLSEAQQIEDLYIDSELDIRSVNEQWIRRLMKFHPHGPHNDLPLFKAKLKSVSDARRIGADKSHLKFKWMGVDCIAFNEGDRMDELQSGNLQMAFHIEYNEFMNKTSVQLRVVDFQLM